MSKGIGLGTAALALGELQIADRQTRNANVRAVNALAQAESEAERANSAEHAYAQLLFNARSQVHGFRARIEAHKAVENVLIAALQTASPDHPLGDRDVVDALVEMRHDELIYSPAVLAKTYLDGKAPEGSIPVIDGSPRVKGGLPSFPMSAEKRAERLLLIEALESHNMSVDDAYRPAMVEAAIGKQRAQVHEIQNLLDTDAKKSFFAGMGKKKRAVVEDSLRTAEMHLGALEKALVDAMQYAADVKAREEKRVSIGEKLSKLGYQLK